MNKQTVLGIVTITSYGHDREEVERCLRGVCDEFGIDGFWLKVFKYREETSWGSLLDSVDMTLGWVLLEGKALLKALPKLLSLIRKNKKVAHIKYCMVSDRRDDIYEASEGFYTDDMLKNLYKYHVRSFGASSFGEFLKKWVIEKSRSIYREAAQ